METEHEIFLFAFIAGILIQTICIVIQPMAMLQLRSPSFRTVPGLPGLFLE